jgi:hypothetical protein
MEFPTRRRWSIPRKADWPRKASFETQFLGVPVFCSKGDLIAVMRLRLGVETDTEYNNRIGRALLEARHVCKLHNNELRSSNDSSSDRRKPRPSKSSTVQVVTESTPSNSNVVPDKGHGHGEW